MIEVARPKPELREAISEFFVSINTPEIRKIFAPHEFSPAYAEFLCRYEGRDEYYFLLSEGKILGYGLLRGWDEGYANPSLGICIRPGIHGKGLGLCLMYHLVAASRIRNASAITLKVKKVNTAAIELYRKMGFKLTELDGEYLKGVLSLERENPIGKKAS